MDLSCERTSTCLTVAARDSALSRAQVQEVLNALNAKHPTLSFAPHWIHSTGDRDQKTSLRELNKTDFFTKEIDDAVLCAQARLSIHSAKDLPEPLAAGLQIVAITQCLDARDVLVLRKGETIEELAPTAKIATSSIRREDAARAFWPQAQFCDVRGSIPCRLAQLDNHDFDALVTAECALMRLGLADRPRVPLPGETTPLQGRIAILARADDQEMSALFSDLDSGLRP